MDVIRDDIWVCQDCLMFLCNGDLSGCEDDRAAEVEAGCVELGECIVPDFDSNADDGTEAYGIEEFSRRTCEGCGTHLAGDRHRFAQLGTLQAVARS